MKYAVLNLPCVSDTRLQYSSKLVTAFRHPVYAWLGLRPFLGQHTPEEHAALQRWAQGRTTLAEKGVSALALREEMSPDGALYSIDPFHLSRLRRLNFTRRAAHKIVLACRRGKAIWIEKLSHDVAKDWKQPLDLIVIDGDHPENGVQDDWNDWNRFVKPGGVAIFHDAFIFEGGWTNPDCGPVKLVVTACFARKHHRTGSLPKKFIRFWLSSGENNFQGIAEMAHAQSGRIARSSAPNFPRTGGTFAI